MSPKAPAGNMFAGAGVMARRDGGMQPTASREIAVILKRDTARLWRLMRHMLGRSRLTAFYEKTISRDSP